METVAVEKWTPERRRQLTRDTLIEAAAAVFARRGFHGASLDEIAETAGFTRGAIYKNFADKEDLFFAGPSASTNGPFRGSPSSHREGTVGQSRGGRREVAGDAGKRPRLLHSRCGVQPLSDPQPRGARARGPTAPRRRAPRRRFMQETDDAAGMEMPIPGRGPRRHVPHHLRRLQHGLARRSRRSHGCTSFLELFTSPVFGDWPRFADRRRSARLGVTRPSRRALPCRGLRTTSRRRRRRTRRDARS